jgi:hypothetical protein
MKNFKELSKTVQMINKSVESFGYEFYSIDMRRREVMLQGHYSSEVVMTLQLDYHSKANVNTNGFIGFNFKLDDVDVTITLT